MTAAVRSQPPKRSSTQPATQPAKRPATQPAKKPATQPAKKPERLDPRGWRDFTARYWGRAPGVLPQPQGEALPLGDVFEMAVVAAAPFVEGTRFWSIPDVRFFAGGNQLRAPGERLPLPSDRTLPRYLARLRKQHTDSGFQLVIAEPLVIDFALWRQTRALLGGLFDEIGVPVLPLACELLVGTWPMRASYVAARRSHAALTFVLAGELTAQLRRRAPGNAIAGAFTARAGEALYWPGEYQHEETAHSCAALRVWIPEQGSRIAESVRDVATSLLDRRMPADHAVPYVPLPEGRRHDGTAEPLKQVAALLGEVTRGGELERAMQIQWAKRVSALSLEPVPPALAEQQLDDEAAVVLSVAPLRMPLGDDLSIWAVNGHAFSVRDEARARAVMARLADGPLRIAQLAKTARPAARELVRTLLRLRAARVDATAPTPTPTARRPRAEGSR